MSSQIPKKLSVLFIKDGVVLPGATVRLKITSPRGIDFIKTKLLNRTNPSNVIIGIVPVIDEENKEIEDGCNEGIGTIEGTKNEGSNEFLSRSILMEYIKEGETIGTAAAVIQVAGTSMNHHHSYSILVTGIARFYLTKLLKEHPHPLALVDTLDENTMVEEFHAGSSELRALVREFRNHSLELLEMLDSSLPIVAKIKKMMTTIPDYQLADIVSSIVSSSRKEKIDVLNATDLEERFRLALPLLERQLRGLKTLPTDRLGTNRRRRNIRQIDDVNIQQVKKIVVPVSKKRSESNRTSNDIFHRIGERFKDNDSGDEEGDEIKQFEHKILNECELPEEALKVVKKEIKRLKQMPQHSPEYPMLRNYIELVSDLPWNKSSMEVIDIHKAKEDLNAEHYAMNKVKRRILEYLAVRQLNSSLKGPILCFAGPPGVGKTSIGKSIANTIGRKFHRISLGGVSDQSEIRGHRRTYIGSMPGRFIQALKTVGVNNPVFLLDEIDKMSRGIHGDPTAALLEVLDPEQNAYFVDHYLNVPFDLSQVMFIATANDLRGIPPPLRDRMEIIPIPGYTIEDKIPIANKHLFPKQLKLHGLNNTNLQVTDDAFKFLVSKYTREAGVRGLERKLGALCRAAAVHIANAKTKGNSSLDNNGNDDISAKSNYSPKQADDNDIKEVANTRDHISDNSASEVKDAVNTIKKQKPTIILNEEGIEKILGPTMYDNTLSDRIGRIGVAMGLAWTSFGGEVLVVEASKMSGNGDLVLTGQLGDVMKESATIALSWIRSHSEYLGISENPSENLMDGFDLHVHFPAGAIGKDGPSAGVTITTALVSLFTNRVVVKDLAMTGEITLRGVVLPVGGVKEKVIAAHVTGVKTIILPERNRKDLKDIPDHVKDRLNFKFVKTVEEVIEAAFNDDDGDTLTSIDAEKLSSMNKL